MGRLEKLLTQLESAPHARGHEFELHCKWFLENDPIYATQLDQVWLWKNWPGRWGPDTGIDLVARTKRGELWAIQAKAYAPESTVSKAHIDSLLSESSRPGFAFRLLIATTDRLSANARWTLAGQKVPAWRHLDDNSWHSCAAGLCRQVCSLPRAPALKSRGFAG